MTTPDVPADVALPGVPDGTAWPWMQDDDGVWHRRPTDDGWHRGADKHPATAMCGQGIDPVRLSTIDPRVSRTTERHDTGDDGVVTCAKCERIATKPRK